MFPRLASLLALLPMMLHSIVGCCWHHEHAAGCGTSCHTVACVDERETAAELAAVESSTGCHQHEHAAAAGDASVPPCPDSPCDEERCVFASVTIGVTQTGPALTLTLCCLDWLPTLALPVEADAPLPERLDRRDQHCPAAAGQLRALTQVWLV